MASYGVGEPVFQTDDLRVEFDTPDGIVEAVQGLSISVHAGQCVGVVGQSGSGKSQTVLGALGLLASNGRVSGSARLGGAELLGLSRLELDSIRGGRIGMIFQDPLTSLTPHMSVGDHLRESLRRHRNIGGAEADAICLEWLERTRIPEAARRLDQFPHELSGGMRQRVMIALAMLCEPQLLIADEPTTALDVTVQAEILELMDELRQQTGAGVLLITHDMGVVARMCDQVVIMNQGCEVENGSVDQIFAAPDHDYTRGLIEAAPRLDGGLRALPEIRDTESVARLDDVRVHFPVFRGLFSKPDVLRAVDGVSFDLRRGETLGVVGESGCGKSTLARSLLRLVEPESGLVTWMGRDITDLGQSDIRPLRKDAQIVFQDPLASLDPRMTASQSLAEPLKVFRPGMTRQQRNQKVMDMIARIGLDPLLAQRYPHQMSGGQNQRLGIARAMIADPALIVCDEAVSALDVSVQALILDLLVDLQSSTGVSILFISHDLSVIREISHRIIVLYLGRVVEMALREELFNTPRHPYTRALLAAVPRPDPALERSRERIRLTGEPPSPLDPGTALRFLPSRAGQQHYVPRLVEVAPEHLVAEHDAFEGIDGVLASAGME